MRCGRGSCVARAAESCGEDDGRIAYRVDSGRDSALDLAQRDLFQHDGRFEAGSAGALQIEAWCFCGQT